MTWAAREQERRRNATKGDKIVADIWARAFERLVLREGGADKINQTELGPKLGVHQATVSSWIAYATRSKAAKAYLPSARALMLMPEALGVNPLWLFFGLGKPTDAVDALPESRQAALRGYFRLLQDLREWVEDRETEAARQMHQAPEAEVADTIASAIRGAVPRPSGGGRIPGTGDRRADTDADTPRRRSAAGE